MSRVIAAGLLLASFFSTPTFSNTQNIEASQGFNFVAVELKVGDNSLQDLFPSAPVGTLIFTWDNHAGWSAAQMYPFGWSHPHRQILPWEGAVMFLPSNVTNTFTLHGEIVPIPRADYTIQEGAPEVVRFYRGSNLIPLVPRNTSRTLVPSKS